MYLPNIEQTALNGYIGVFVRPASQESQSILDYYPARINWTNGNFSFDNPTLFFELLRRECRRANLNEDLCNDLNQNFVFRTYRQNEHPCYQLANQNVPIHNTFLNLALKDYFAARTLLIYHQEFNSIQYATSCIEKLFKYFILQQLPNCRNFSHRVHLMYRTHNTIIPPDLFQNLQNVNLFLEFLEYTYSFRYQDGVIRSLGQVNNNRTFIISKKLILNTLDSIFANLHTILQQNNSTTAGINFFFTRNVMIQQFNHTSPAPQNQIQQWINMPDMITEIKIPLGDTAYNLISYTSDDTCNFTNLFSQTVSDGTLFRYIKIFGPTSNGRHIF